MTGPLSGLRVVVTRPRSQAASLGELLERAGAEPIYLPVIEIADPPSFAELDRAVGDLAQGAYQWVVFTSANAAEKVLYRALVAGVAELVHPSTKVAAVGRQTASLLADSGIVVDLVPEEFTGESLVDALGTGPGDIFLPRAADAPPTLVEGLEGSGWLVDQVAAYMNRPVEQDDPAADTVRRLEFDVLTFASGSAVRAFAQFVAEPHELGVNTAEPPERLVAVIGPRTSEVAQELGFRRDIVASDHTAEGLVAALTEHISR